MIVNCSTGGLIPGFQTWTSTEMQNFTVNARSAGVCTVQAFDKYQLGPSSNSANFTIVEITTTTEEITSTNSEVTTETTTQDATTSEIATLTTEELTSTFSEVQTETTIESTATAFTLASSILQSSSISSIETTGYSTFTLASSFTSVSTSILSSDFTSLCLSRLQAKALVCLVQAHRKVPHPYWHLQQHRLQKV